MATLTCVKTRETISLTNKLAASGEGSVWVTDQSSKLAKLYHQVTPERLEKLETMLVYPPVDPKLAPNHITYAWPESLLRNKQGKIVGFLMPRIVGASELIQVYTPLKRKELKLAIDWHYLHVVAYNLALAVHNLHEEGYVLGDIKAQNILVNSRGLVSIIDTDSFQVRHPLTGKLHHCLVGSPDYTPPDLLGKDFSQTEQNRSHDRFRLGVIFYQLLFGVHPFADGKWLGNDDPPELQDCLRQGLWPYSGDAYLKPGRYTIPLDIVHPSLKACFLACFNDGHRDPQHRPTAEQWKNALNRAVRQLVVCPSVESHVYAQHAGRCYWCDRSQQLGTDIFAWAPGLKRRVNVPKASAVSPQIKPGGYSKNFGRSTYPVVPYLYTTTRVSPQGDVTPYEATSPAGKYTEAALNLPAGAVPLAMVAIPGGTFIMGSPESEAARNASEGPQHQVTVPNFFIGQYEVTQAQYEAVMGNNPSNFKRKNSPVENVSWDDAQAFIQHLNSLTGKTYRLPTEAEWEYAARAGTSTPFSYGETITPKVVNYKGYHPYGNAPKGRHRGRTIAVDTLYPNPWGLYHIHGNVWEWVEDGWHNNYNGVPTDGTAWLSSDENRVLRGGSWYFDARYTRSAYRVRDSRDYWSYDIGFRVVLVP